MRQSLMYVHAVCAVLMEMVGAAVMNTYGGSKPSWPGPLRLHMSASHVCSAATSVVQPRLWCSHACGAAMSVVQPRL